MAQAAPQAEVTTKPRRRRRGFLLPGARLRQWHDPRYIGPGNSSEVRGMVRVYKAWVTRPSTRETAVTGQKGTLDWIAKLPGGKAILETEEDVDPADLDDEGRYIVPRPGR
jgi:hypothetical protein